MSIPALMTLNSCMQEDIVKGNGEEVTANITLNLPGNGVQSRTNGESSTTDAPTASTENMRLFISIFDGGKLIETIEEASVSLTGEDPYNKPIRLLTGKTYKVVVWADYGDTYYNYDDETATVSLKDYEVEGNQVKNDAYFIAKDITLTASENIDLTLTRPFGLVQVTTTDWNAAVVQNNKPATYTTTISVPTELNLFDGTVDNVLDVTYTGKITNAETAEKNKLSFDYILAGAEQSPLTSFTMDYNNAEGGDVSEYTFDNIPVKRNYITNITGNVLTKVGSLDISVNQAWNDTDLSAEIVDITPAELATKLAEDMSSVTYKEFNLIGDITADQSFDLGSMSENGTIVINMNDVTGNVTFKDDYQNFSGTIKFTNKSANAVNMTVTVPNGDATIGNGNWGELTTSTKATTLRIEEGATVSKVTVAAGNVNIYQGATVSTVAAEEGVSTTVYVAEGATKPSTSGDNVSVVEGISFGQIVNTTTGKDYATIGLALSAAKAYDVIELAEGEYPLNLDIVCKKDGKTKYYLPIETEGLTLRAKGNRDKTIIYGLEETANTSINQQNLITVMAKNVTIEGLTIMPKKVINKTIEITADGFTLRNCKFTPNTYVEGMSELRAGSVYFTYPTYGYTEGSINATIENCEFIKGNICFDHMYAGTFNIKNNVFDNQGEDYPLFTTSAWMPANNFTDKEKDALFNSRMVVNISNNTFNNVLEYTGENYPIIRCAHGMFNLEGNKFPTNGIYWKAMKGSGTDGVAEYINFGSIFVNYNSMVSKTWVKDRTNPISFAISNDVIEFETQKAPANTWYAWHGRKAAVNMNKKSSWEVSSTLTVTGDTCSVNKSMWLNIGIDWPIVLFKQENGVRTWRYWDSNGDGQWLDVPSDKNVPTTAGNYEIKIKFNNGVITEYINDIEIASYEVSEKTSAVKEIIFNSYSIGESYKTTWTYPVVR